jgi:hypothetical protein
MEELLCTYGIIQVGTSTYRWIRLVYTSKSNEQWELQQFRNYLQQRDTRTYMMLSGILSDIRIIFDKGKWRHLWFLQVFASTLKSPSTKEKRRQVWSHQVLSSTLKSPSTKGETKTYMMSSGILISTQITFHIEKRRHVWCPQVFS